MPEAERRRCTRCGEEYFADGYTFCPACDVDVRTMRGVPVDAPERVRRMRALYQRNLAAGRPQYEGVAEQIIEMDRQRKAPPNG